MRRPQLLQRGGFLYQVRHMSRHLQDECHTCFIPSLLQCNEIIVKHTYLFGKLNSLPLAAAFCTTLCEHLDNLSCCWPFRPINFHAEQTNLNAPSYLLAIKFSGCIPLYFFDPNFPFCKNLEARTQTYNVRNILGKVFQRDFFRGGMQRENY